MRILLAILATGALLQQPPGYSVVQDGEPHGDAPYLLEEGWEPLLNGRDLSGWKACDPAAKNECAQRGASNSYVFERSITPLIGCGCQTASE
jgi:hypothetical protein